MGFSIIGTIIAIILILPTAVFFSKFPPKNTPEGIKTEKSIFTLLEGIGRVVCFSLLIISKDYFDVSKVNIWLILMILCIVTYYALWIRYVIKGQDYRLLWDSFLYVPVPLAVFPVGAFIFAALWGGSILLLGGSVFLGIGHIKVTWNTHNQLLEKAMNNNLN